MMKAIVCCQRQVPTVMPGIRIQPLAHAVKVYIYTFFKLVCIFWQQSLEHMHILKD